MEKLEVLKLKQRLQEAFGKEPQDETAKKIYSSQSNISKWLSGQSVPPTERLIDISKTYKVSVDWLLGISNEKEIDGVVLEKMTYENTARIIDKLIEWGILEIPDLEQISRQGIEDEEGTDDEDSSREPRFDSDYIKINDRILSFMLRRRFKIYEVGDDMVDFWKNTSLPKYRGLRLLKYNKEIENLIDTKNWASFTDGDWVSLVNSIANMTQEEILTELSRIEKER